MYMYKHTKYVVRLKSTIPMIEFVLVPFVQALPSCLACKGVPILSRSILLYVVIVLYGHAQGINDICLPP